MSHDVLKYRYIRGFLFIFGYCRLSHCGYKVGTDVVALAWLKRYCDRRSPAVVWVLALAILPGGFGCQMIPSDGTISLEGYTMGIDCKQLKRDCEKELAELKCLNDLAAKNRQQDYVITHFGEKGNCALIAEPLDREGELHKAEIKKLEQKLRILSAVIGILGD